MVIKIAITGNIASGKSQVEKILEDYGYKVFDTDKIAHDVLNKITEFYGYDVFTNGKIDRKKLGKIVFSNTELKQKLEAIVHPEVKSKIKELFKKHNKDKYIFISVPLLYETGFETLFDKVMLICADKNLQIKRLISRNNFTEQEALSRINSQLKQEEKIAKADYVIENNTTLEDLKNNVNLFLKTL